MMLTRTMIAAVILGLAGAPAAFAASTTPAMPGTSSPAAQAAAKAAAPAAKTVTVDPSCPVKGNINAKGAKIYYDSSDSAYSRVKINAGAGDKCFMTVDQAKAAGFRAPKHG